MHLSAVPRSDHETLLAAWEVLTSYLDLWNDGADEDATAWLKRLRETIEPGRPPETAPTTELKDSAGHYDLLRDIHDILVLRAQPAKSSSVGSATPTALGELLDTALRSGLTVELSPYPYEATWEDVREFEAVVEWQPYDDDNRRVLTDKTVPGLIAKIGEIITQRSGQRPSSAPQPDTK